MKVRPEMASWRGGGGSRGATAPSTPKPRQEVESRGEFEHALVELAVERARMEAEAAAEAARAELSAISSPRPSYAPHMGRMDGYAGDEEEGLAH